MTKLKIVHHFGKRYLKVAAKAVVAYGRSSSESSHHRRVLCKVVRHERVNLFSRQQQTALIHVHVVSQEVQRGFSLKIVWHYRLARGWRFLVSLQMFTISNFGVNVFEFCIDLLRFWNQNGKNINLQKMFDLSDKIII